MIDFLEYSVKQAALFLNVTELTIRRYIKSGMLEAKIIPKGRINSYKVTEKSINDFKTKYRE